MKLEKPTARSPLKHMKKLTPKKKLIKKRQVFDG